MTHNVIGLRPGTVIRCDSGIWSIRIAVECDDNNSQQWKAHLTVRQTDRTILEGTSGNEYRGAGRTLAGAVNDAVDDLWTVVHDDVMTALCAS